MGKGKGGIEGFERVGPSRVSEPFGLRAALGGRWLISTMKTLRLFWRELVILAIWAIAVVAKIKYHGLIFGFDYGLYQPDGIHYTYRTLTFLGQSQQEAAQQVVDWYSINASKLKIFSVENMLPETNPVWGVVSQRTLYPILSVPFVAMFGITGMLAVPAISLLVLMIVALQLGKVYNVPNFGLVIALLLTCSQTVMRWMIVNCTDALLAGLFGLVVLILVKNNWSKKNITFLLLLCTATSFTRICLPVWILIALVLFYQKHKTVAVSIALLSIILSIPTFLAAPSNAILPSATQSSGLTKLFYIPISFIKIITFELAELAVLDRTLLFLIVLTVAFSLKYWRYSSAQFFFAVFIATFVIGAINGELGVNFRYQMPQIPFMAWVLIQSYSSYRFDKSSA
jgi:hypothetical protein